MPGTVWGDTAGLLVSCKDMQKDKGLLGLVKLRQIVIVFNTRFLVCTHEHKESAVTCSSCKEGQGVDQHRVFNKAGYRMVKSGEGLTGGLATDQGSSPARSK